MDRPFLFVSVFGATERNDLVGRTGASANAVRLMRPTRSGSPRWMVLVTIAVALGYAWIAAGQRPFTTPENLLVAVPIIGVGLLAARRGRSWRERPLLVAAPSRRRGSLVWVALAVGFAVWELNALYSSPRDDHPTLSSIADWIMSVHAGRAALFLCWLALGAALALRPTRPVDR
jgi:hypothetical protein